MSWKSQQKRKKKKRQCYKPLPKPSLKDKWLNVSLMAHDQMFRPRSHLVIWENLWRRSERPEVLCLLSLQRQKRLQILPVGGWEGKLCRTVCGENTQIYSRVNNVFLLGVRGQAVGQRIREQVKEATFYPEGVLLQVRMVCPVNVNNALR